MTISTLDQYIAAASQRVGLIKTALRASVATIPFSVFDLAGNSHVQLGIKGTYKVKLVKDAAGNRFLSVLSMTIGYVDDHTRERVLEVFALSLIEREEDAKEAK